MSEFDKYALTREEADEAVAMEAETREERRRPTCTCDGGSSHLEGGIHQYYCELNHPHHPCYEETCGFFAVLSEEAAF